ncbi:MAG TPA: hypothetical protein VNK41_05545, partial [Vicinamibacterales bacterium]|nr:hypothetical protein [Vicinamibacterales bacterium]
MRPAAWLLVLTAAVVAGRPAAGQDAPFIERVEVVRVLVDVRVLDDGGAPVLGLGPSDFAATIGGRPVRVESAEWVGQDRARIRDPEKPWPLESAPPVAAAGTQREPSGRLIVFLVQKDLEPRRVAGLMRLSSLADHLLAPLTAEDRVAILSFDSRLRIWIDFTNDFARV